MIENEKITLIVKALRGEATADELRQLRTWTLRSDENRRELEKIRRLWQLLEADRPMSDIELGQQRERFSQRLAAQRHNTIHTGWWRSVAAVVTALLLAGGSLWTWQRLTGEATSTHQQVWKEQRGQVELILSDGQRVNLSNTDTLPSTTAFEQGILRQDDGLNYSEVTTDGQHETLFNQVTTLTGSTYHLTLSDGTQVWLNAQSDLRFPVHFEGRERRVYLHGEAFFEVAHDTEHPFLVSIHPGIDVRVYGTHFDVDTYDIDHVRTTLLEGSVGIIDNERAQEYRLQPNETALFNALNGRVDITSCDATDYVQWRTGLVTFYDEPLCQVMARLCRLHDIEVCYSDDSVRNIPLSGMMHDSDDTDALLETLQTVSGLSFTRDGHRVIISQR